MFLFESFDYLNPNDYSFILTQGFPESLSI